MILKKVICLLLNLSLLFNTISWAEEGISDPNDSTSSDNLSLDPDPLENSDEVGEQFVLDNMSYHINACLDEENGGFKKNDVIVKHPENQEKTVKLSCDEARILHYNMEIGVLPDPEKEMKVFCEASRGLNANEAFQFAKSLQELGLITELQDVINCPGKDIPELACFDPRRISCIWNKNSPRCDNATGREGTSFFSGCMKELMYEFVYGFRTDFHTLTSLASGAASYVADGASNLYSKIFKSGEEKSSDAAHAHDELTHPDLEELRENKNQGSENKIISFFQDVRDWITNNRGFGELFMCPEGDQFWDDETNTMRCENPVASYQCGTCAQKQLGICRLSGFILKEVGVGMILSGGAGLTAKLLSKTPLGPAAASLGRGVSHLATTGAVQLRKQGKKLFLRSPPFSVRITRSFREKYFQAYNKIKKLKKNEQAKTIRSKSEEIATEGFKNMGRLAMTKTPQGKITATTLSTLNNLFNPMTYFNHMNMAFMAGLKGPAGWSAAKKAIQMKKIRAATLKNRNLDKFASTHPISKDSFNTLAKIEDDLMDTYDHLAKLLGQQPRSKKEILEAHDQIEKLQKSRKRAKRGYEKKKLLALDAKISEEMLGQSTRSARLESQARAIQLRIDELSASGSTIKNKSRIAALSEKKQKYENLAKIERENNAMNRDLNLHKSKVDKDSNRTSSNTNSPKHRAKNTKAYDKENEVLTLAQEMAHPRLAMKNLASAQAVPDTVPPSSSASATTKDAIKRNIPSSGNPSDHSFVGPRQTTPGKDMGLYKKVQDTLFRRANFPGNPNNPNFMGPRRQQPRTPSSATSPRTKMPGSEGPRSLPHNPTASMDSYHNINRGGQHKFQRPKSSIKKDDSIPVRATPDTKSQSGKTFTRPNDGITSTRDPDGTVTILNAKVERATTSGEPTFTVTPDATIPARATSNTKNQSDRIFRRSGDGITSTKDLDGTVTILNAKVERATTPDGPVYTTAKDGTTTINRKTTSTSVASQQQYPTINSLKVDPQTHLSLTHTISGIRHPNGTITATIGGKTLNVSADPKTHAFKIEQIRHNETRLVGIPLHQADKNLTVEIKKLKKSRIKTDNAAITPSRQTNNSGLDANTNKLEDLKNQQRSVKAALFQSIKDVFSRFRLPDGRTFTGKVLGFKNGQLLIKRPSGKVLAIRTSSPLFLGLAVLRNGPNKVAHAKALEREIEDLSNKTNKVENGEGNGTEENDDCKEDQVSVDGVCIAPTDIPDDALANLSGAHLLPDDSSMMAAPAMMPGPGGPPPPNYINTKIKLVVIGGSIGSG